MSPLQKLAVMSSILCAAAVYANWVEHSCPHFDSECCDSMDKMINDLRREEYRELIKAGVKSEEAKKKAVERYSKVV